MAKTWKSPLVGFGRVTLETVLPAVSDPSTENREVLMVWVELPPLALRYGVVATSWSPVGGW